ncbi:MAG: hypothetical protein PHQ32_06510 [Firmicutes bacterium]|nr:hypothetical protein [Bacillota bacterium]
MSIIKSFSVGVGDTFYIKHNNSNFTIIDCYLNEYNRNNIIKELISESKGKNILRFISTHPDDDHIKGLKCLDDIIKIRNFYCVKNEAFKKIKTEDFIRYCELRDSTKAYYLFKGCRRKWMNKNDETDGKIYESAGINILWPNIDNYKFKEALLIAKNGGCPNNISPIFTYSLKNGANVMWMGDIEEDFLNYVENEINWKKMDIVFAPHHGRYSGKIPRSILNKIKPKIIVIGEAPSDNLNYYNGYNTITQNSAGDIVFDCKLNIVDIYVSSNKYKANFLSNQFKNSKYGNYIGTLNL